MQSHIVLQRCYHVNRDGTVETWSEPICRKELVMVPEQTRTYSRYIGSKDIKPYMYILREILITGFMLYPL